MDVDDARVVKTERGVRVGEERVLELGAALDGQQVAVDGHIAVDSQGGTEERLAPDFEGLVRGVGPEGHVGQECRRDRHGQRAAVVEVFADVHRAGPAEGDVGGEGGRGVDKELARAVIADAVRAVVVNRRVGVDRGVDGQRVGLGVPDQHALPDRRERGADQHLAVRRHDRPGAGVAEGEVAVEGGDSVVVEAVGRLVACWGRCAALGAERQ